MRLSSAIALLFAFSGFLSGQYATTPEQLRSHVYYLASDSLLGRGFGTPQGEMAARYIAREFEKAGVEPLNGTYFHSFNHRQGILNIPGTNVAGVVPGSDPDLKEEYIVIGAHYDHLGWKVSDEDTVVYNGADDNASGTAAMIEIGRNLASGPERPGRSVILVAFDGEESGLIGSKRFIEDETVPLHRIKLMFSLDMVGMYAAHEGLDLYGVKLLRDAEELIGRVANQYGIEVRKANSSVGQRTDTAPFGKLKIPAVHAFTGTESPYHKPEDVREELDYEGMSRVTNYLSQATLHLSMSEDISELDGLREGETLAETRPVVRAGILIGTGTSKFNYRDDPIMGKSIFAAHGGVFTNIRLAGFLRLQPAVLYETRGSQVYGGNFRSHAVTVPVSLQVSSPEESFVRTYFHLGGYYSYHFAGQLVDEAIDFSTDFHNQDYGITYGFGFEAFNIQLGLNFHTGLSNILKDPVPEAPESDLSIESVCFTVGYLF